MTVFSPGFYQGNRGQGPRGYQGYQQQRPYGGGQDHQQHNRGVYQKQQNNLHLNFINQQQGKSTTAVPHDSQAAVTNQATVTVANQNAESRIDDRSLVHMSSSQKQSKEVKTQPTCVVTPFVPLQVIFVFLNSLQIL